MEEKKSPEDFKGNREGETRNAGVKKSLRPSKNLQPGEGGKNVGLASQRGWQETRGREGDWSARCKRTGSTGNRKKRNQSGGERQMKKIN